MRIARSLASTGVIVSIAALAIAGCSGNDKTTGVSGAKLPSGAVSESIDHEACDEGATHRVVAVDTNNDGKPDIKTVYDKASNKLLCRISDLNHDQKPDMYEYFDDSGALRRKEFCFSDDGVVNSIETYENGKLVRREYDTTGQHRIDTWDTFDPNAPVDAKTGRPTPTHRERDTTGDGRVDQWWDWAPDGTITIAMDKTGSGHPDPATKLVIEAGSAQDNADGAPPTVTITDEAGPPTGPDTTTAAPDAGGGGG